MAEVAEIYENLRKDVSEFVRSLPPEDLQRELPATRGWNVRDVVAHLTGDAVSVSRGDFPTEFFAAFGTEEAVTVLNLWTQEHVASRQGSSLEKILDEWEAAAASIISMMRGEEPWPGGLPPIADRVLLTDLAAHQQDIFGAFGVEKWREDAPIKMAVAGYIAVMDLRLREVAGPVLRIEANQKSWTVGGDDPVATVQVPTRFELFRALSGRRSRDQISAYDWEGDPTPFLPYFYPYGVREEALVE